ncbi:hypothetical protein U1Q18_000644, partial [Sarracenia purpurea var. burkii]
ELREIGIELGAAKRANKTDVDGRATVGDPEEGVLEGGAPVGGEKGGDVGAGAAASPVGVVLEVAEAFLDNPNLGELVFWIVRL